MNLPILCISLLRAYERRCEIEKLWIKEKQCEVEFVDAIDRRDVLSGIVKHANPESPLRELTAGEIACSLSHAKAIHIAKERNYNRCIVIEDDAIPLFTTSHELNTIINHHDHEFPCSSIALLHNPTGAKIVKHTTKKYFSSLQRAPYGTYGYMIKFDEYDRLHNLYSSLVSPADWYWNNVYTKEQNISIANTPLVDHQSQTTYIGNEFRGNRRKFLS